MTSKLLKTLGTTSHSKLHVRESICKVPHFIYKMNNLVKINPLNYYSFSYITQFTLTGTFFFNFGDGYVVCRTVHLINSYFNAALIFPATSTAGIIILNRNQIQQCNNNCCFFFGNSQMWVFQ